MNNYIISTPLYELENYHIDNHIYIMRDDLLPFSFGGNKVRIALEFFEDMKRNGYDCIISYGSTRSNLNRVIANMAYSKEIPCYVITPDNEKKNHNETYNNKLIKMSKANIIKCTKNDVSETVQDTIESCESQGFKPYYIYGDKYGKGNETIPITAYERVYQEICTYEDMNNIKFDYIFHASGTGMTQSGLICGMLKMTDKKFIVGISISRTKEVGLNKILESIQNYLSHIEIDLLKVIHFEDKYTCSGYGKFNDEIIKTINGVYLKYGIPLDLTYTGKAFWGMTEYIKENRINSKNILFIHTGGMPLFFDDLYTEDY